MLNLCTNARSDTQSYTQGAHYTTPTLTFILQSDKSILVHKPFSSVATTISTSVKVTISLATHASTPPCWVPCSTIGHFPSIILKFFSGTKCVGPFVNYGQLFTLLRSDIRSVPKSISHQRKRSRRCSGSYPLDFLSP